MRRQLLTNCRLFDGETIHEDRAVLIDDGRIVDIAGASVSSHDAERVDLAGHLLAPGLVDLQVNGGGGVLFNDAPTVESLQTIVSAHRRFGTTACLPTLISDDAEKMGRGIAAVSAALAASLPAVRGIHLEGPHLDKTFRGVHDESKLRAIDDEALTLICSLTSGRTLVTLAPELVAPLQIRALCDAGVIVFGGHSAATYEQVGAALAAGMSGFTHLFNAMTPFTSRMPGMVGAALDDADSFFGIIADGHHVHPASLRIAIRAKAKGKACLVTDAMPTVGSQDKHFELHGNRINAVDGRCVTESGTLAGSDIGMIDAVRNVVRFGGVTLEEALRMASLYPAAALGLADEIGRVSKGYCADLIELDDDLKVVANWINGAREIYR